MPKPRLFLALAFVFSLMLAGKPVLAQSIGLGSGLGIPLMDYFTDEESSEYRSKPQPGYYAQLRRMSNALGSLHLHANLLLDFGILSNVELRIDLAGFAWSKSRITHVSCSPLNNRGIDSAQYYPLDKAPADCIDLNSYRSSTDISSQNLSRLWFLHIAAGARQNIVEIEDFILYGGAHLGFTLGFMTGMDNTLGANIDATLGMTYKLSPIFWIELQSKATALVTQVPSDTQKRINHDSQTGGNIFTSLLQANAYLDLQLAIRIDIGAL